MLSGSTSVTVCDSSAMTPVQFKIENALSADVLDSDLPNGVVDSFAGEILTISGIPDIDPGQSIIFSYTVTTTNNDNGCSPEASFTAQIIVNPSPVINPAPGSNTNPTLCAFEQMTPLEFTVSNPAFGLELDAASTISTLDGVTTTLNIRPQIVEHTLGGAGGVTETITININGNENFSISATGTTTVDDAGNLLAQAIHQDNKYISAYDAGSKILRITSAFDGVAFSTAVVTGTSIISISIANLIQTSAVL